MVYARNYIPLALCFLVCMIRCPIVSCNEDHDRMDSLIVGNDNSYENYDDVVSSDQTSIEDNNDNNKSNLRRTIGTKSYDNSFLDESKSSSKRVKVNIYDESLCIDCQDFILNILIPTYEELGPSIMDLSLVSFGNARYMNGTTTIIDNTADTVVVESETTNNSNLNDDVSTELKSNEILVCQHGIAECDTNAYNLCVADIYKYDIDRYLPYVACLFEKLPMGYKNDSLFDVSIYASCAQASAVDWYSIKNCHSDKERVHHLEQNAYQSTPKDHKYVPWIVVNEEHYEMDVNMDVTAFKNMICTTFTKHGGKHPACSGTIDNDDDDNKSYLHRTALSNTHENSALHETKSSKKQVKVNIYDESLCSGCQNFILNILVPAYEELGPSIMDLSLISFGNARYMNVSTVLDNTDTSDVMELETTNNSNDHHVDHINDVSTELRASAKVNEILVCQHGIAECDTNAYNLCVADIYKYDISRYLPYVTCLFEKLPMGYKNDSLFDVSIYASCARSSVVDWYSIKNCHSDKERVHHLEQQAYQSTPKDHQYVPWIVINDVHYEANDNMDVATFKNMICTTFTKNGGKHPACSGTIITTQTMVK